MINVFLRWLSEQRKLTYKGRTCHRGRAFKAELERLERRLVLSHSHIYNKDDEFPKLQLLTSGYHTISIYEDLTGDGFTPDDVLMPISIPVRTYVGTLTAGEVNEIGGWRQNDTYTTSESVHVIANGGTLHHSTQLQWDDLNPDGVFQPDPDSVPDHSTNPPRPGNRPGPGFDHILYQRDSHDEVDSNGLFPVGQNWVLTSDEVSGSVERLTYVREFTVRGKGYEDRNGNGHLDAGEPPIQANVYLDRNGNGNQEEPGEPGSANNADGTFEKTFRGRGKIGFGYPGGAEYFSLTGGRNAYTAPGLGQNENVIDNIEFGLFRNVPVEGRVFDDLNGDGIWHFGDGEGTVPGIPITVKQNGKTYTTTSGVDGYFAVYLGPGAFEVSQDLSQLGIRQTAPTAPAGYSGNITTSGQSLPNYLFGRSLGKDLLISAATRADAKGIDFTWQSTSGVGPFQVQVFQSTDLVWDINDLPLETPLTITPNATGGTGSGRVNFRADYVHNSIRPYLIAVADPNKKIGEANEQNNAFVVQRIIDLSPLQVTGDFTYDAPNDQFVSNGAAQVGFKPLNSEAFVPLVGGNITYDPDHIKISGTVTTNYGDMEIDLFDGNVTINVHSGGVSSLNVVSGVWELAGCKFAFDQFSLVNPGGGSAFDSYLNVQGYLVTPGAIGALKVQFTEPNFIHFGPQTHGISATIQLGDAAFTLDAFLTLVANGASLSYLSKTEANPEGALRLQGKFFVQNEGLETKDDTRPSLDISGPNYVEFGANGVFFVGQFGIKNFCVIRDFLTAKSGSLFLDTVHHEWKVEGELEIKSLLEPTVIVGAGMYDGDFNYIKVGVGGLDIPTFMAGIFLNKVSLAVDGLAGKKKNPLLELIPIEVTASLSLSEGPKIKIPEMPLFGVEGRNAAVASMDITGTASLERVAGTVLFTYMDPKVATVTGGFDWSWKKNEAKLTGGMNVLNGTLTGAAAVTVNQRGVTGSASLIGSLRIPKGNGLFYPAIAEGSVRAYFQALNVGETYAAFAMDVTLPVIGRKSITMKVSAAKGDEYFFGDMVALDRLAAQSLTPSSFGRSFSAFEEEGPAASNTFTVTSGTQQLLLSATWANELEDAMLELVRPDGTILMESDLDGITGAVIPEMTSTTSRAIAILDPMEGDWTIRVVTAGDPGETEYAALRDGVAPTIELLDAQVTPGGVTIQYSASDIYPDATVALFYDTDNTGFDGLSLIENLPVTGEAATYNWDLHQAFSGTYYLYAVITDAQGNVHFQYLDTPVTFDADPPTSRVTVLSDITNTSSFTVSWSGADDTNGSGLASYDIYVSDNGGDYTLFLHNTTSTTAEFTGQFGHTYTFYSVATDTAGHVEAAPPRADAQTATEALANQPPDILDDLFSLPENSLLNAVVGTADATDPDTEDTLTYSITGGNSSGAFAINPATGEIRVANPVALDFETTPSFALTIQVADDHGHTDSASVTVNLTDVEEPLTLTRGGSDVNWIGKHGPVNVLPQVTVTGTGSLAGGTLTITVNSPGKKKPFDQLTPASVAAIGTLGKSQFVNGHLTLQVQLNGNATIGGIQTFLRGLKFSTKGAGQKVLSRTLGVTLSAGGQSTSISQTIHVQKK